MSARLASAKRMQIIIAAIVIFSGSVVHGAVFRLEGVVTSVDAPAIPLGIDVGSRWSMQYEFDPEAEPYIDYSSKVSYLLGVTEVSVGPLTVPFGSNNALAYIFNNTWITADNYQVVTSMVDWQGLRHVRAHSEMIDYEGLIVNSFDLPAVPFDLTEVDESDFQFTFTGATGVSSTVDGVVDSFVAIPEPATLGQFSLAAFPFLGHARRRNRWATK